MGFIQWTKWSEKLDVGILVRGWEVGNTQEGGHK